MSNGLSTPNTSTPESNANALVQDKRQSIRVSVNDLAELLIDINGTQKSCHLHNLSSTGAMIEYTFGHLPKRLVLQFKAGKIKILCRVVWHCGQLAGLEFINKRLELDLTVNASNAPFLP